MQGHEAAGERAKAAKPTDASAGAVLAIPDIAGAGRPEPALEPLGRLPESLYPQRLPFLQPATDQPRPPRALAPARQPSVAARNEAAVPSRPSLSIDGMRHVAGAAGPALALYDADVVILAFDRPEETVQAIASALEQRGVSRHVFVVDQGSQPETMQQLFAAVAGRSDATLVSLGHNLGVAGGRNRGSELGRGRVIVGLDNDAVFANRDTLAAAVAALDAEPALAAIGLRILTDATGDDDVSSWGYPRELLSRSDCCFDAVTFVGAGHAIRRNVVS